MGVDDSVRVKVRDSERVQEMEVEGVCVVCGVGVRVTVGEREWIEVGVREVGVKDAAVRVQLVGVRVPDGLAVRDRLGEGVQEAGEPVVLREGVRVCVLVRVGVGVHEGD